MSNQKALVDLLLSLFSADELRRFLRYGPLGHEIETTLPGPTASGSFIADEAVKGLSKHGMVNDAFFARLTSERPHRSQDIESVGRLFATAHLGNAATEFGGVTSGGSRPIAIPRGPMRLSKSVRRALHEAIKHAFPDRERLTLFIHLNMGESPATILVNAATIDTDVLAILTWAEATDRVGELVREARAAMPTNKALVEAERVVLSELTAQDDDTRRTAEAFGLALAPEGLEAFLPAAATLEDTEAWRATMLERDRAVCRIDRGANGFGTGFLVGPDLILTCAHVVSAAGGDATALSARFDHRTLSDGSVVDRGTVVPVVAEVHRDGEVDYALLRLETPMPGRTPVPLRPHTVASGQPILILQHPHAKPKKLGQGACTGVAGTTLKYAVNTEPGSSGSPVFNASWDVVALHRQGGVTSNEGRIIGAVAYGLKGVSLAPASETTPEVVDAPTVGGLLDELRRQDRLPAFHVVQCGSRRNDATRTMAFVIRITPRNQVPVLSPTFQVGGQSTRLGNLEAGNREETPAVDVSFHERNTTTVEVRLRFSLNSGEQIGYVYALSATWRESAVIDRKRVDLLRAGVVAEHFDG